MRIPADNAPRRPFSRRALLGGIAGAAGAAILAACGDEAAAPTPTTAATRAATTTGATGATTAPTTAAASAAMPTPAASAVATTGTMATTAPAVMASPAATTTGAASPAAMPAAMGKPGGSILIGTLGEARTINPFLSTESEGDWRIKMLFDQFVRIKPDTFEPKPALARAWKVDGNVFTFTLADAKFSDGSDVTAEDVAFTMRGILAKATASGRASKLFAIQGAREFNMGTATEVAGIKVMDAKTLVVTLAQPDAAFLINLRFVSPVPKKLLDGKDLSAASKEAFFQKPVGAGPYLFQSWQVGGDFVMAKNPNYYRVGFPYLDKVTHRTIPDAQSLVNALLSGDIDASVYPSPAGAAMLRAKQDLTVVVPPFSSPDGWTFNLKNPYLAKKEVRQAIAYSLDTAQFARDSLYGLGEPGRGPIAPGNYAHDKSLKPLPYDLDRARALIRMAGQPPTPPTFSVNKGNVLREDFLTYTQAQLDKIGLKINAEVGEYVTLVDKYNKREFEVFGAGVSGATIDPSQLFDFYSTGSSQNFGSYSNPRLDELLRNAKQELNVEKQTAVYKEVQAIIQDDLPTIYAWYRPFLHVTKKKFAGYTPSSDTGGFLTELETWYING